MKTNLDALHRVPEIIEKYGTYARRIGKTFYSCHLVAGYLEVCENETIIVYVHRLDYINHFIETLRSVLQDHEIEIDRVDYASRRVYIKNNSNCIKIMTMSSVQSMHPIDACQNPSSYDLYVILDMDYVGKDFWSASNNLTIATFSELCKIPLT